MPLADKEAGIKDLWDQMEKLAKSVSYTELPQSCGIRSHMTMVLLLCVRDALYGEKNHAEIHAKVASELQLIREAYKNKETQEPVVIEEDEAIEDTLRSSLTARALLVPGSQEEPIDLILEHDCISSGNTSGRSCVNTDCNDAEERLFVRKGSPLVRTLSALLNASTHNASRSNFVMNSVNKRADLCDRHQNGRRYNATPCNSIRSNHVIVAGT
ncbi:hypothetical protein QM012_004618 [Aureobasidium pullulans]|uniref:Uncharacterized protein n=1 Tax=Aureobasidium pullulans TaxID=5580 RepID=A0ABR0TTL2_AURPU